jgi:hypothetical protein
MFGPNVGASLENLPPTQVPAARYLRNSSSAIVTVSAVSSSLFLGAALVVETGGEDGDDVAAAVQDVLCHKADGAVDDHHQLQAATLAVAWVQAERSRD